MENYFSNAEYYLIPLLIAAGGLLLGLFVDRFLLARLMRLTARTRWEGDDMVIKALRGYVALWIFILALYQALNNAPVSPYYHKLLTNTLVVITVISVTIVAARVIRGIINIYLGNVENELPSTSLLGHLAKIIVYIVGFLIILQHLGISIAPILTALGVGGLAVALALQDTLSNMFAGIQILVGRQIRVGDYVKLQSGEEGFVNDITLRNTTIRQMANNMIIIPNSTLADSIVTNYNLPEPQLSLLVPVGVSYSSHLPHVEQVTIEVAKQTLLQVEGHLPDIEPVIRYNAFADSSINFNVIMRSTEFSNQFLLRHEFIKNLHARYLEEKIEIPFPIRTLYMKS